MVTNLRLLQECFRVFDRNETGLISHQDLLYAAQERSMFLLDREVDALIREVGILRHGFISYHEFIAATLPRTVYLDVSRACGSLSFAAVHCVGLPGCQRSQRVSGPRH